MQFEISSQALKHGPWSISKLGVIEACQRQFEYKYILKHEELVKPSANTVGKVSHKILELRVIGTDAQAAKRAAVDENPLTSMEAEDLLAMEEAIETFVRDFDKFCKSHGVTELFRETQWGLDSRGNPTPFFADNVFFRGVMDLGAVTKDGDLIVVDHKSGLAKDISKNGKKYREQLNSYAIMGLAHRPNLAGVRGMINFLQGAPAKRRQWLEYISARHIREVLTPWLYRHINTIADRLPLESPYPATPKPKWPCSYCSYRPGCSAYAEMMRAAEV